MTIRYHQWPFLQLDTIRNHSLSYVLFIYIYMIDCSLSMHMFIYLLYLFIYWIISFRYWSTHLSAPTHSVSGAPRRWFRASVLGAAGRGGSRAQSSGCKKIRLTVFDEHNWYFGIKHVFVVWYLYIVDDINNNCYTCLMVLFSIITTTVNCY